ncbi:hypothetical protein F5B22DRAFT_657518 [Xylaria bambusicola]|uniref:uncharacterized protein n=1 Tax=Xylaria bambusicola TaxID=326684 RepID=UPI002008B982|nr:uncharacterized protein F5B22DRAFT_657518 [Xylaria bambusicola]KAI0512876.1 hypothetical protein F5B22DRAFT_657518 [Xylaria bambusicola]
MDFECSWTVKKYQKLAREILKNRDEQFVYVNVVLTKIMPGKQHAALLVKLPDAVFNASLSAATPPATPPCGLEMGHGPGWLLPGTVCLPDEKILDALKNEVHNTLYVLFLPDSPLAQQSQANSMGDSGLRITKFKSKIHKHVMNVEYNGTRNKALILTFRAKYSDTPIVIGEDRYSVTRWATEMDLGRVRLFDNKVLQKIKKILHCKDLPFLAMVPNVTP